MAVLECIECGERYPRGTPDGKCTECGNRLRIPREVLERRMQQRQALNVGSGVAIILGVLILVVWTAAATGPGLMLVPAAGLAITVLGVLGLIIGRVRAAIDHK